MRCTLALPLATAAVLLAAGAAAQEATFTRIADTATPVPGGGGATFTDFGETGPALDAGRVAFEGTGPAGTGIYAWNGTDLVLVADPDTMVTGGTLDFAFSPTIHGDYVAFDGEVSGADAVYRSFAGVLVTEVAGAGDAVPGTPGDHFTEVFGATAGPGAVAFFGAGSTVEGVYLHDLFGASVVADTTTPIPDGSGETFDLLFAPFLAADGRVAFLGSNASPTPVRGVFVWDDGSITRVAGNGTVADGGAGPTLDFFDGSPSFDAGQVAFWAEFGAGDGIFVVPAAGGPVTTVAMQGATSPEGAPFSILERAPSTSQGRVLFVEDDRVLWLWDAGSLTRLVGDGDLLDGEVVAEIDAGPEGLDGDLFAFTVYFEGDTPAVYLGMIGTAGGESVLDVPTLDGLGLAALAAALALLGALALRRRAAPAA